MFTPGVSTPQPYEPPATPNLPAPAPVQPQVAIQPFGEPEPILVWIGPDIRCTATKVFTPSGEADIADVFFNATDTSSESTYVPTINIVLGILLLPLCLLGLIFLLQKQTRITGFVQANVQGPRLLHTTNIPAGPGVAVDTFKRIDYARGLASMAKQRRELDTA